MGEDWKIEPDECGLTRNELLQKHFHVYGRMLDTCQLRQQILPMLEIAGLISGELVTDETLKTAEELLKLEARI